MDLTNRRVAPATPAPAPATGGRLAMPRKPISGHREIVDRAMKEATERVIQELGKGADSLEGSVRVNSKRAAQWSGIPVALLALACGSRSQVRAHRSHEPNRTDFLKWRNRFACAELIFNDGRDETVVLDRTHSGSASGKESDHGAT